MSVCQNLFIGPYAEWRVRISNKKAVVDENAPWYEQWDAGELPLQYHGGKGDSEIKVGRVRYAQHFFMPREERPNQPPREMSWGGTGVYLAIADWSWLNPRAEIDWFSEAFQPELQMLAEYFGESPAPCLGPGLLGVVSCPW